MNSDTRTTLEFTLLTTSRHDAPPTYFAVWVQEDYDGVFTHEVVAEIQERSAATYEVLLRPSYIPAEQLKYVCQTYQKLLQKEDFDFAEAYGVPSCTFSGEDALDRAKAWVSVCLEAKKTESLAIAQHSSVLLSRACVGNLGRFINLAWYPIAKNRTINLLAFPDGTFQVREFVLFPFNNDYSFKDCLISVTDLSSAFEVFVFYQIDPEFARSIHPEHKIDQVYTEMEKTLRTLQKMADAYFFSHKQQNSSSLPIPRPLREAEL